MSRYALSSKIKDLCSSLSLKQLIEEPTRVTPHSSTLLDLIMTNSVNISKAGVIDPGVIDHSLIYVIRKFKRPKGEPKIIRVRSFKNFVDDDFLRDLRNSDWSYFLNLIETFKFTDYKKNQKIGLSCIGKMYGVSALLTNAHTCLYRNNCSHYFDIEPPILERYLI